MSCFSLGVKGDMLPSLQNPVCNLHNFFESEAKFSSELRNLNLDFIKFPVEKVDLHAQGVSDICKSFLISEPSVSVSV